MRYDVIVKCNV